MASCQCHPGGHKYLLAEQSGKASRRRDHQADNSASYAYIIVRVQMAYVGVVPLVKIVRYPEFKKIMVSSGSGVSVGNGLSLSWYLEIAEKRD